MVGKHYEEIYMYFINVDSSYLRYIFKTVFIVRQYTGYGRSQRRQYGGIEPDVKGGDTDGGFHRKSDF